MAVTFCGCPLAAIIDTTAAFTVSLAPTDNNTFDGWYKEAALTNKVTFPYDVSGVTANITLYAKWEGIAEAGQLDVLYSYDNIIYPIDAHPFFDDGEGGLWDDLPFIVRTDQPSWEAISNQTWCQLDKFTDVDGEDGFYISFDRNASDVLREVTITVNAGNAEPVIFSIPQKGDEHGMGLYMGTWRFTGNDGTWQLLIISADKVVFMNDDGYNFIMDGLTWTETVNPVSNDYFSDGYKVTGTLTSTNEYTVPSASGSGNASAGGEALVTFYIGLNKNYIAIGNPETAQQEAYYYPYSWKVDAEYLNITWNLDGGLWQSNPNQLTMVAKDGKLAAPKAPTKTGWSFGGWYKEASLTNQVSFPYDVSTLTGDFTLYAKWNVPATLSASGTPLWGGGSCPASGGTLILNIASNTSWTISAPSWCSLSPTSGSGDRTITVTVLSNNTYAPRVGYIYVRTTDSPVITRTINVPQL